MDTDYKSFIEVQFPISKISKESYKERKSAGGQTITGLGKWWGRKPLILVRASLLGLLMPSSNKPQEDRKIFLKILSMDNEGLIKRRNKTIPLKRIYESLTPKERIRYFQEINESNKLKLKSTITAEDKQNLQILIFNRFSYDRKLQYCIRPEELKNLDVSDWDVINTYLGTNSTNLRGLISELGRKKFGKIPLIGDCFCGGGSIPFEAGRIGCHVNASDLNPIAGLLTWSDLNILNKPDEEIVKLREFQEKVYDAVVKQVDEWRIEKNEMGWRAKFYLYCHEIICPECGTKIPIAPSWVISESFRTVGQLVYNEYNKNFQIIIKNNASDAEIKKAMNSSTVKDGNLQCPHCNKFTSMISLRKDKKCKDGGTQYGLRQWCKNEFHPQENDIFQERLYCIKYVEKFENKTWKEVMKKPAKATDSCYGTIHYTAPTTEDIERETEVIALLKERFNEWQEKGFIPNTTIEDGYNTDQPKRTRGWTYWHHLFNPRQLLIIGLFMSKINEFTHSPYERAISLLGVNKLADFNSKLTNWSVRQDLAVNTFYNQALNPLYNFAVRGLSSVYTQWIFKLNNEKFEISSKTKLTDAREIDGMCDLWITDPPYADAVNYHELSEFFIAWDKKLLSDLFPNWYADSKRALAVKGVGQTFNNSMIEIYKNLTNHMSDNGMQIVMFTHQDVKVWAELTMILWSAGLRVVSAWNIATETESGGLKNGNYVKGTVLLVLKKQISEETVFQDELYPKIKAEVKSQIDSMKAIDEGDEPNFEDADYLLASYASSLKVLTTYKQIEGIDIQYELSKSRNSKEVSSIEQIIKKAKDIAYDYLIPFGFDQFLWKTLSKEERFYIKGLELEKNKSYQLGAYQELARGYGVNNYKDLFENTKANKVRLKTPMEFKSSNLQNTNFGSTLTRNVLMALYQSVKAEDTAEGKNWLKAEYEKDKLYWKHRKLILEILNFLSKYEVVEHMEHWNKSSEYAKFLKEVIKNDGS